MAEGGPVRRGKQLHEVLFDFDWIGVPGQTQSLGQPFDMGIDSDAGHAEGIAKDHVGGFPSDPRQRHQFLQCPGNLTGETLHQLGTALADESGLVPIIAGWSDEGFQFGRIRLSEILSRTVTGEQSRRDLIDPLIRALGGENGGDEQLQRVVVTQGGGGMGIDLSQQTVDGLRTLRCRGLLACRLGAGFGPAGLRDTRLGVGRWVHGSVP